MEQVLADAFLNFYQKVLKPEFDALKGNQAVHDERLAEVVGHLDSIYKRLGILEDGYAEIGDRLKLIEDALEAEGSENAGLEQQVKDLKKQLKSFQDRLNVVERQPLG
ncbi:hypothetical protein GMLC_21230 [Geomonas limicola]|uniref:Uncharacterized protein n=1 Tax=Geomonas limicola TaxID=2740186 RepID=A0A6V8N9I3_9BACT|nr:hypothetical protein [Geomonas limicola]GFO68544.1 hypothetical protein GMLC_21230 [Geomonas limicola]